VQPGFRPPEHMAGVYAFNASTGNLAWLYFPVPGFNIASSPAIFGGISTFAMMEIGNSLNAVSGKQLWSVLIQSNNESSSGNYSPYIVPSLSIAAIVCGYSGTVCSALNASNGAFVWSNDVAGGVLFSTPVVANGVVYVSTTLGGPLGLLQSGSYSLRRKTGAFLWNHVVGSIRYSFQPLQTTRFL